VDWGQQGPDPPRCVALAAPPRFPSSTPSTTAPPLLHHLRSLPRRLLNPPSPGSLPLPRAPKLPRRISSSSRMAAPSATSPMASVSRVLRPRPACPAPRLGRGLGIACSLPSHGGRSETRGLGLPVASALSATAAPVLRSRQILCKAEANVSSNLPESLPAAVKYEKTIELESPPAELSQYEKIVELLTTLFPVWVMLGTVIGIYKPAMVTWLSTDLFTVLLGFLMLSMGLTLTFEDFRRCLRNPWTVCFCILVIFVFYIQLRSNI